VSRQSLEPSRDPADYSFVHRLRTRFAETDAMGVVHHAAYLPYLEEARVEYLRSIGHPYEAVRSGSDAVARDGKAGPRDGRREFPVLEVFVRYRRPLHFDEEVEVALTVGAVTRATFQIAYLLSVAGVERATAVSVHGCVDRHGRPTRLPGWVTASGPVRATPA
jgi:acyl-CoA thioester hydrolase